MLRRFLFLVGALALAVLPASATWSIVAINARTGEVAVASATCLPGFNLRRGVPVIVVGRGAAAAQSFLDTNGMNRRLIFFEMRDTDATPEEILADLAATDPGHQTRQYGICAFTGDPVTFSGTGAGQARGGVTGQIGDYVYAVQGNLLTGSEVVFAAEQAFVDTDGDMGQRLMAAMQAAKALGGDGRCSCLTGGPTDCGVPPPDFEKSAHVGFVIVARMGDRDGRCNQIVGCADGTYYMRLNFVGGGAADPDPVDALQSAYDLWRERRLGRPDGVLSTVTPVDPLPADGLTKRAVTIQLVDVDGIPLTTGGAELVVQTEGNTRQYSQVSPVVDRGDGTYSFTVTAGTLPGTDRYVVTATDDLLTATLFPFLEVRVEAPLALHAGRDEIAAGEGASIPYSVNLPEQAHARYGLFWRIAGVAPRWSVLPGTRGVLDERGHAEGTVVVPAGLLRDLVGLRMGWLGFARGGGKARTTNAVGFEIVP